MRNIKKFWSIRNGGKLLHRFRYEWVYPHKDNVTTCTSKTEARAYLKQIREDVKGIPGKEDFLKYAKVVFVKESVSYSYCKK